MYVAHLGDSGIVLARSTTATTEGSDASLSEGNTSRSTTESPGNSLSLGSTTESYDPDTLEAVPLTVEHKPDVPEERERIESLGGEVRNGTRGVPRVVWKRVRQATGTPGGGVVPGRTRSQDAVTDFIPFLGVSRALGDLWSYNAERDVYVVSPEPDVAHYTVTVGRDRFLLIASDGVWNVMSMKEAVVEVAKYQQEQAAAMAEKGDSNADDDTKDDVCHSVLMSALKKWRERRQRADNVSLIVVFLEPPDQTTGGKTNDVDTSSSSSTDTNRTSSLSGVSTPEESDRSLLTEQTSAAGPTALVRQAAIHEPGNEEPPAKRPNPPLQEDLVSSSSSESEGDAKKS